MAYYFFPDFNKAGTFVTKKKGQGIKRPYLSLLLEHGPCMNAHAKVTSHPISGYSS